MSIKYEITTPEPAAPTSPDAEIAELLEAKQAHEANLAKKIEARLDPSKKYFIMREIIIDKHNVRRYRELLSPSMCQLKGCNFDASKFLGFKGGWATVPLKQKLKNGQTVQARILEALQDHKDNAHKFDQAHILSEEELQTQKSQSQRQATFLRSA